MDTLTYIKAVFLGALQGATEFLPISSSGHLVLAQQWLGIKAEGGQLLTLDIALHFATLLAVVAVYYRDLLTIGNAFMQRYLLMKKREVDQQALMLGWYLIIGTLPAVFIGLGFKDFFEGIFKSIFFTGMFLCVTGLILWTSQYAMRKQNVDQQNISWKKALGIGMCQACAILPGISRSGSTIVGGLWFGLSPLQSARFSFLLAIPVILGGSVLELNNLGNLSDPLLGKMLSGMLAAFLVGYASIRWLLRLLNRGQFNWFAYYCWFLGGGAIVSHLLN